MLKKILNNEEFLIEKTTFNLIFLIIDSEKLEYYTDGENYLICRSSEETPIWIWNKDSICKTKIEEVVNKLQLLLDEDNVFQITSKKEIFEILRNKYKDLLVKDYFIQKGDHLHMLAYKCLNPVLTREKVGHRERPTEDDIETIMYFNRCDIEESITNKYYQYLNEEQLYNAAKKHISSPTFYVWKVDGRIVATAGYNEGEKECRIGMVFTSREHRCKGYAGMIVYELCQEILVKGKTPMLYADYDYLPSNRSYQKIGFEPTGDLYNIKLGKGKMKELKR